MKTSLPIALNTTKLFYNGFMNNINVIWVFVFSPSAFEKSALAQSVIEAFPQLKDPHGITGYVSTNKN